MAFTTNKLLTDLIDASVQDHEVAQRLLREHPELLRERNRLDETALHFLTVESFPVGVDFLAAHGAEVDTRDFSSETPLMHAA